MKETLLKPKQIKRILELRQQGYVYEDIAKQVKCSVSSVKKYLKLNRQQAEIEVVKTALQPLQKENLEEAVRHNKETIEKILELLCDENAGLLGYPIYAFAYGESEDVCLRALTDAELSLWNHMFHINRELAKQLFLKKKPYEPWLKPMSDWDRENLEEWIKFVKKHCPELLAEFV